uniref:Uncharacterized protein n=1 Tax=Anguilla anguilla TaxID=7936 RepID=A0A0E9QBT6_ANGAN
MVDSLGKGLCSPVLGHGCDSVTYSQE